jgi:hypothetical protein
MPSGEVSLPDLYQQLGTSQGAHLDMQTSTNLTINKFNNFKYKAKNDILNRIFFPDRQAFIGKH